MSSPTGEDNTQTASANIDTLNEEVSSEQPSVEDQRLMGASPTPSAQSTGTSDTENAPQAIPGQYTSTAPSEAASEAPSMEDQRLMGASPAPPATQTP